MNYFEMIVKTSVDTSSTHNAEPKKESLKTLDKPCEVDESLNERMAIMGEECETEQVQPYVTESGILVIPFNSLARYHYWKKGGKSVCDTLRELGRCDLIPLYKSNLSKN